MNARLVRHGIILALLGSITGFAPFVVANPRMGVAAHVGGIMNALLLLALGAVWSEVAATARQEKVATWLLVVGAYGNWVTVLSASLTGAQEFAPLAGAGHGASLTVEKATFLLISVAVLCTLAGLAMIVLALGKRVRPSNKGMHQTGRCVEDTPRRP